MNLQDELESIIDSVDIPFFETELYSENAVYLDDAEALLQFARLNRAACLFYMYEYYIEEDYTITADAVRGWDKRILEELQPDIRAYNAQTRALDFSQPCGLFIYCLHQGFAVVAELDDDWLEAEEVEPAAEALDRMLSERGDLVRQIHAEREQGRQQTLKELTEHILRDPEFYKCTDQRMRMHYMGNLMRKIPRYRVVFHNRQEHAAFINAVWAEWRSRRQ